MHLIYVQAHMIYLELLVIFQCVCVCVCVCVRI